MSPRLALGAAARLADKPLVALLLSAVYPAVFLLSLNWYALRTEKIVFVLLIAALAALTAYLFIRFAVWALFACLPVLRRSGKYVERESAATRLLTALVCIVILFFFMYGTLLRLLVTDTYLLLCFLALTALIVWLALNRLLRYWTAILSIMTLTSLVTWGQSVIAATVEAAAEERSLIHSPFNAVKFKRRPNIYLIVYDGYGSRRLHHDVFGVDNAAIYQELAARNFKMLDTYSNYWGSWDSMLSVFLAAHHYYDMMAGLFELKDRSMDHEWNNVQSDAFSAEGQWLQSAVHRADCLPGQRSGQSRLRLPR